MLACKALAPSCILVMSSSFRLREVTEDWSAVEKKVVTEAKGTDTTSEILAVSRGFNLLPTQVVICSLAFGMMMTSMMSNDDEDDAMIMKTKMKMQVEMKMKIMI